MKFADLYVGMVLRDNDPRYEGRTVTVTNTGVNNANDGGVYYHTGKRDQFIKAERIFNDGKVRHQGWSVCNDYGILAQDPSIVGVPDATE